MPLVNCKIELKLKWRKHSVLFAAGADTGANLNNINFTFIDTKLYVRVVTLPVRDNQNYQKFLAKNMKDQFIEMNIKQEVKLINIHIFSNQNLLESIDNLVLFIRMEMTYLKDSKLKILVTKRHNQTLQRYHQWKKLF